MLSKSLTCYLIGSLNDAASSDLWRHDDNSPERQTVVNIKSAPAEETTPAIVQSGFLGTYVALYNYHPPNEDELELQRGDILHVIEKRTDGWWKARKRASFNEVTRIGWVRGSYLEEVSREAARQETLLISHSPCSMCRQILSKRWRQGAILSRRLARTCRKP